MKKIIILFSALMLLSACAKQEQEPMNVLYESDDTTYTYVIPFEASDTRNYHSTYQSRYSINEIGIGMEEYSSRFFKIEDYYAQEGTIITRSILSSLVGRESDTNPQGLNPSKGSEYYVSDTRKVTDAVIVTDVFELDFIEKEDESFAVSGLCVAVVVNDQQEEDGRTYTIKTDRLWEYATNAGRKLESYLRTLPNVQNIPLLILIYNSASSDSYLPGGFMGYAYYSGRSGQFTQITDTWVLIPTSQSSSLDSELYNQFIAYKSTIKNYLPENIAIIGQAQYEDDKATYLRITVGVQAKTYAEVKSLTQYCAQQLMNFTAEDMRIIVHIKSNDDTFALIERKANEDSVNITYVN